MNTLKTAVWIVAALSTVIGGAWAIESHYATKVQLVEVSNALQQHTVSGALYDNRRETWQYQDRLKAHPDDPTARERLRQLEYERERLEREQRELKKGGS